MYVCVHVCLVFTGVRKESDSLKLELPMVISHHVDAEN